MQFSFRHGDVKNIPSLSIGPRFGTRPQKSSVRTKRCAASLSVHSTPKQPKQTFKAPTSTPSSSTQPLLVSPTESLIESSDAGSDVSVMLSEFSVSQPAMKHVHLIMNPDHLVNQLKLK